MVEAVSSVPRHVVVVVGGATAGSEIARILAEHDVLVIVIEQNPRPFGKIEDGLPRWHVKQRRDEYDKINARLSHPNIEFVPLTGLGRDVNFDELREGWRPNALVLAHGAWRDRPFPVEGADEFVDRGLVYQNSLIYWFNHLGEAGYRGPHYLISPGAIVVGGGLASIDVMKVLQIELTLNALADRGVQEDMLRVEREGIEPVLRSHGLTWRDLGLAPCKLFYRRRSIDMPLSDIPPDASPKRAEALRQARVKIMEKAQRKYLFEFQDLRMPTGLIVEAGRLAGLEFTETQVVDGKARVRPTPSIPVRARLTVSSIGSVPAPLFGVPRNGEVYRYADQKAGLLMGGPTAVFAAGNVLTGKGNIKESLKSGSQVGMRVARSYLGLATDRIPQAEEERSAARTEAEQIEQMVASRAPLAPEDVERIMRHVRERQRAVGYEGDYRSWIARATPPDLQ